MKLHLSIKSIKLRDDSEGLVFIVLILFTNSCCQFFCTDHTLPSKWIVAILKGWKTMKWWQIVLLSKDIWIGQKLNRFPLVTMGCTSSPSVATRRKSSHCPNMSFWSALVPLLGANPLAASTTIVGSWCCFRYSTAELSLRGPCMWSWFHIRTRYMFNHWTNVNRM